MSAVAFCSARMRRIQMVNGLLGSGAAWRWSPSQRRSASLPRLALSRNSDSNLDMVPTQNRREQHADLRIVVVDRSLRALPAQTPGFAANKRLLRFRSGAISIPVVEIISTCRRAPDCKYAERMHRISQVSTTPVTTIEL
jgi:hypothetical protein